MPLVKSSHWEGVFVVVFEGRVALFVTTVSFHLQLCTKDSGIIVSSEFNF